MIEKALNPLRRIRRYFRVRRETEEKIAFQLQCLPAYYMPGIGLGEFVQVGNELVGLFRSEAGLRRDDVVLDIGCGLARVAIPLQRYLTRGSYEGFDIVPDIIHWNEVNVTGVSPHFRFRCVEAASTAYNPAGPADAASVTFPYADSQFTFAIATSLFSHLLADAALRYFAELSRVMRAGGRAFLTFFLLDVFALERAKTGKTNIAFPHAWEHGLLNNLERPEDAVAYDAAWILSALRDAGLEPQLPVRWGRWSEREGALSYQDVVIVNKRR